MISLGVRDLRENELESLVVVKMGKISMFKSLKNKLISLFLNSYEIEPTNGILIIRLKSMSFLSFVQPSKGIQKLPLFQN